jgi:hypothetical protein
MSTTGGHIKLKPCMLRSFERFFAFRRSFRELANSGKLS